MRAWRLVDDMDIPKSWPLCGLLTGALHVMDDGDVCDVDQVMLQCGC
jgi:hypothetical protein